MKYDYPMTDKLIKILKTEYRQESLDKGNSWRMQKTIEDLPTEFWLINNKLAEEYKEIRQIIERIDYNEHIWFCKMPTYRESLQAELIDLILVACMAYERLDTQ